MKVLVKYLLKSIFEKKGRMLLILFSISISAAFLVTSTGVVQSVLNSSISRYKNIYEDYSVVVSPKSNSCDQIFNTDDVLKRGKSIKKGFRELAAQGYFNKKENENFNLIGTTYNDFKGYKSIKSVSGSIKEGFDKNKVIISSFASQRLKLKVGDKISLGIMGQSYDYKVAAIASNNGLFLSDITSDNTFTMITSTENVSGIYGTKNKINAIMLSVKGNERAWVKNFNSKNKAKMLSSKLLIDKQELSSGTNDIKTVLIFMLGIVLIMAMFIIYGSFKLIVTERIPVIGTFLSQGAQFGNILRMFLTESFIYGALGGVIGDILGAGLIYFITNLNNPLLKYGVKTNFTLNPKYYLTGFIFAVVLSIISAAMPILGIVKMPVKNVILNTLSTEVKISWKSFIIGIVFIALTIVMHITGSHIKNPRPYILAVPSIILGFTGVILIIPKFTDILLYPLVRALRRLNGTAMISLNNVRTSKLLTNNIRLISVSVMSILLILSIKVSIGDLLTGCYKNLNYDVSISAENANITNLKVIDSEIEKYSGIKNIFKRQRLQGNINGDSGKELELTCIEPEQYKSFDNYTVFQNKSKQLKELEASDKGIIISRKISLRYKLKPGSVIKVTSGDKTQSLKILSVCDVKLQNMGNRNFISLKTANKYFDVKYVDSYYINTKASAQSAKSYFVNKFRGTGAIVTTKKEDVAADDRSSNQTLNVLGIFSYVTMIIGAFAMLSNITISFMERKREMAVLCSVGLTNSGRMKVILGESILEGLIGIVLSIASSLWLIVLLEDLFKFLVLNADFKYPYGSTLVIVIATAILMIVTSIPAIKENTKFNIVNELKYE